MSIVNDIFIHAPDFDGGDRQFHHDLFNRIKAIANDINQHSPRCEEATLAIRALHLALLHTECAIAKKDKYRV